LDLPTQSRNRVRVSLVTSVTLLEVGFSARSAGDLRHALGSAPLRSMPVEYFTPAIEDRAIEVQAILAERGQHRTPSIPDLLIAEVTAQPIERLSQP
jgi:predicted nucleic acid-binding protein